MSSELISPTELHNLISYDPETGALTWKLRPSTLFTDGAQSSNHNCAIWNGRFAGTPALNNRRANGYLAGNIKGRIYRAHRVAWVITTGRWPDADIDHKNRIRTDNRLENLREATRSENLRNKARPDNNRSGIIGVSWARERSCWNVKIGVNGKQINVGYFLTLEGAAEARKLAELLHWGECHPDNLRAILAAQGVRVVEV